MRTSVLFQHNYSSIANVVVNQGGTSSGKTYAILQVLFTLACAEAKQVITVVGQDIPNLKAGAMRDAHNIMNSAPEFQAMLSSFNNTDRVYKLLNGSLIEFKSYESAQDAKSGKRDYLFINEANGIAVEIYHELALRTRKRVFLDYNPNAAFWVHDQLIGRPDVQLIISDHRHNPFVDDRTRQKIEELSDTDPERWKVYARGITGKVTGQVLSDWSVCDAIPPDAKRLAYGLDFGFSNDETGLLEVYLQNGQLWVNELLYRTGLTNTDLSERMQILRVSKKSEIIADSAEPKSIEELRRMGWYITPAKKGADSIKHSIDILRRYHINVTRSSVHLRRELERYQWRTDAAGRSTNQPTDTWNHLIDPLRYVALNKLQVNSTGTTRSRMPWKSEKASGDPMAELI